MKIVDYRFSKFNLTNINSCGNSIGKGIYPKLFAIENYTRILINSILRVQYGKDWWDKVVDKNIKEKAKKYKNNYLQSPWHSLPGLHDIYFIDLKDLNEIIRSNNNLFFPIIKDIDLWMGRIEQIRLPRNVVAHMNWPGKKDKDRISVFYQDFNDLIKNLENNNKLTFIIP